MTDFLTKVKVSYPQDWKAYDKAQINEQKSFMKLLSEVCRNVEGPEYKFGRPSLLLSDMTFASALKVYSTFSLRRFMGLMHNALEEGYVQVSCSYSSISNFMRRPELVPILEDLITLSSVPLSSIENILAVDSSGFSTSRFARYFSYKHGKDMNHKKWIKANVICGVKTNIVIAAELTEQNRGDTLFFEPLVKKAAQIFKIEEVLADKAYSTRDNHKLIATIGATPFILFKKNANGRSLGSYAWSKMYHYFMYNKDDFMKHYHKRSNCETVFHMIKSKFNDNIRSKDKTAQLNEVLLKILCHNICVLNQEMQELHVDLEIDSWRKIND